MTYTLVFLKVSQGMFVFVILGVRGWTRNIRVAPKLAPKLALSEAQLARTARIAVNAPTVTLGLLELTAVRHA